VELPKSKACPYPSTVEFLRVGGLEAGEELVRRLRVWCLWLFFPKVVRRAPPRLTSGSCQNQLACPYPSSVELLRVGSSEPGGELVRRLMVWCASLFFPKVVRRALPRLTSRTTQNPSLSVSLVCRVAMGWQFGTRGRTRQTTDGFGVPGFSFPESSDEPPSTDE
jgi:hypothetical protein